MLNQSGPELEVALHYCHTRVATTTNLVAGGQRGMLQNGLRNNLEFSRWLGMLWGHVDRIVSCSYCTR